MKKTLSLLVSIILLITLAACNSTPDTENHNTAETPETNIETPCISEVVGAGAPTIFNTDIPREEKEKALEDIFIGVKNNFASWNTFTLVDWNAEYPIALERALATDNIYDFYLELKRFVTLLNDHHTLVWFPDAFDDELWYTPVRFIYINDGYYIVGGEASELAKLPLFSRITKINGIPVDNYMEQNVFPYNWHAKLNTAVSLSSLFARYGAANTSQSFEAITPDGEVLTETIDRVPWNRDAVDWIDAKQDIDAVFEDVFSSELLTVKRVDNDYLYIYIPHFNDEGVIAQFEAQLDGMKAAKGIIIDVRGNRGGMAFYGMQMAAHFISGTFDDVYGEKTVYDAETDSYTLKEFATLKQIQGHGSITAPVVILQDYNTTSSGEHFLDFMSQAENAVLMGTESAGGTGDPYMVKLPEGGSLRISCIDIARHDKTPFLNIGIQPDIYVSNSIEDYINGYDRMLDSALKELKERALQ